MYENDFENRMAPRHLHKIDREDSKPERTCFQERLAATIIMDFQSAVRRVRDHFPRHLNHLSGDLLFRIGVALYQNADMEKARYCLELATGKDGPWQNKAMLLLSRTYETIGNDDRAVSILQDLLDREPEDLFRRPAEKRMRMLAQANRQGRKGVKSAFDLCSESGAILEGEGTGALKKETPFRFTYLKFAGRDVH